MVSITTAVIKHRQRELLLPAPPRARLSMFTQCTLIVRTLVRQQLQRRAGGGHEYVVRASVLFAKANETVTYYIN